ncbi:hypothetical protein ACJX0J_008673, partial [Zea mays]
MSPVVALLIGGKQLHLLGAHYGITVRGGGGGGGGGGKVFCYIHFMFLIKSILQWVDERIGFQ